MSTTNDLPIPTDEQIAEYKRQGKVLSDGQGDSYLLGPCIGTGSFGKVRRGLHIPTKQHVAIKMLNRQALASGNMDKKIKREIKILKLFNHAHICRLYDVIYTPGDIFVVMEHCGRELYDHIVRFGRLDEQQARHIFQQIVCALEYCHHFRVVHRDLKPENILYSPDTKTAKLIDFGLANIMQDGEFLRTSCGSPNYAAPEVISGRLYAGPEVDVWSCGVVLYALLCGCLPFDEDNIPALFSKIKRGTYTIPAHVSPEAQDLIRQILVVDPVLRITISQIRDHPWFFHRLPKHLYYRPSLFYSVAHVDEEIAEQVRQVLTGTTHREIREAVAKWSAPSGGPDGQGLIVAPRAAVVYNILLDAERQREIQSDRNKGDDVMSASSAGTAGVSASQAELNHGLVLSVSPAISLLLDTQDAMTNKRAYNSTQFLPRSAHEITKRDATSYDANSSIGRSPGGFAFSAKALGSGPSSFSERVGSFQQARSLGTSTGSMPAGHRGGLGAGAMMMQHNHNNGSPQVPNNSVSSQQGALLGGGNTPGGSSQKSSLVGVVARTNAVYNADEELFHVQNQTGWRVGLMTDKRSVDSVAEICAVLRLKNMEWKTVAPYLLAVRRKNLGGSTAGSGMGPDSAVTPNRAGGNERTHATASTVVQIHLMRMQERHDKGFVVDFFHAKGCPMAALEMSIEIWRELQRRIG